MLTIFEALPEGLLDCPAEGLEDVLGGPTLLHLPGARPEPLFVSVLLHGNEVAGWEALRGVLRDAAGLPRALSCLIGNVAAARRGVRHLDGQPDYNRIWSPDERSDSPEHRMAAQVLEAMRARAPVACVDVHNTTGPNPHYAAVGRLDGRTLHLAQRFSRTVVHFRAPAGMQTLAFGDLCPAVTLECGLPDSPGGAAHARAYLEGLLADAELPGRRPGEDALDLFRTCARVRIPPGLSFSFQDPQTDFHLPEDRVEMNFRELPEGDVFGHWGAGVAARLEVVDDQGGDVFDRFFETRGRDLVVRRRFFPAMLTLRPEIVEQDCLCYVMERVAD